MAASTANQRDEGETYSQGFFHRSLSPNSFERLRSEHSDYFYKPKRGPSVCKNNITITRPIKTFRTVSKLVELLSQGQQKHATTTTAHSEDIESPPLSKKFDDQKSSSQDSSFLSMDTGDSSSGNSSSFSSRSNSSISTVAEQDTEIIIIDEPPSSSSKSTVNPVFSSPCHAPAIGLNITSVHIHLVLLELYPQNVDQSTIIFQRYLISLITENEHDDWSILNIDLHTINDQQGNFRLFTLTFEQFDHVLQRLETFIRYNSTLSSSFILNIALTGEQTNEFQTKIANRLNKINLNFDLIPCRAETYMIGLDFFHENQNECLQILTEHNQIQSKQHLYPYILVHAEAASTFFYIVHSPSKYSLITTNNLSYKTYENLYRCVQPGYDLCNSSQSNNSLSFDYTRQNLCKHCYRIPTKTPFTSFTRLSNRYLPTDYSKSTKSHYIYRGWSNRRTSNVTTYDVQTQTDDSYLESSTDEVRSAMRRSLLSMLNMNLALTIQLICQLYPSIQNCILTGELFQFEPQSAFDLTTNLQTILADRCPIVSKLKHESLVSALGCALPRVYFDVLNEHQFLGNDCIS